MTSSISAISSPPSRPLRLSTENCSTNSNGRVLTAISSLGDYAAAHPTPDNQPPPAKRQKIDGQPPHIKTEYYQHRIVQCVDEQLSIRLPGKFDLKPDLKKLILQNLSCSDLLSGQYENEQFESLLKERVRAEIVHQFGSIFKERVRNETAVAAAAELTSWKDPGSAQLKSARPQARWPAISESPVPLPIIPNHGGQPTVIDNDHKGSRSLLHTEHMPTTLPTNTRSAPIQAPATPARQTQQLGKAKKHVPTSPSNFRARAHSSIWHGKQETEHKLPGYFTEKQRPYLPVKARQDLSHSTSTFLHLDSTVLQEPMAVHFDFTFEEISRLRAVVRQALGAEPKEKRRDPEKDLGRQVARLRKRQIPITNIVKTANLPRRSVRDVECYLADLMAMTKRAVKKPVVPSVITLQRDPYDQHASFVRSSKVSSLMFAREIVGHRGHHSSMRTQTNFSNEFRKCRDDEMELREEWTNCAGDISTIAWVSDDSFICGTTEHSDAHNQQYNKPGNLVLGSCRVGNLRAYPDHRIVRPIVEKGENSTNEMRESQDPWLYSSVVSSDYDPNFGLAFTSGFDRTVKVWRIEETQSGPSMKVQATWVHGGNVNFVVCSKHESGMVATAADVAADAIRIYRIRDNDLAHSPCRSYSCSRVTDEHGNTVDTEKWAYFPATMQWGLAPEVQHLLLVGYSPRSRTGDDNDIPLERRDSGELCLWDGLTGLPWRITSTTTQNIFEVLWHPSQASFIAATSPLPFDAAEGVRTQIRIFRPSDNSEYGGRAFSPVQTLDCRALDINELTIMPNSYTYCYVTAAATDGKVYVWDTARGDNPIHVLKHGEPIDEYRGDREREDVGVKFTAWGTSPDRFYTGSSDGVVKVWNVRSERKPLVRDLFEAPGPITCGMFSPDRSKLVVGDATGRVFLLSLDAPDDEKKRFMTVKLPNGKTKTVRPPKGIIYHPEPPPPEYNADGVLVEPEDSKAVIRRSKQFLQDEQLTLHPENRSWVVQGPRYAELGLYRRECHLDEDPTKPLLARWDSLQQDNNKRYMVSGRRLQFMPLRPLPEHNSFTHLYTLEKHKENVSKDAIGSLDVNTLPVETLTQLMADKVDLGELDRPDYGFDYEDDYSDSEDSEGGNASEDEF
ncbi:hypothetical protein V8F20_005266 [Naviculisporaceae sp. PSN 640]